MLASMVLLAMGPIALIVACFAAFHYYLRHKEAPEPKPQRSGFTLAVVVVGVAVFTWPIAAVVGITAVCSIPAAGNMCGLLGAIGAAPLVSAAAIWGIAHRWSTRGTAT